MDDGKAGEIVNKQKVLMVHNYYQIPGGEDTVVENEKKLLEAHGHEVILYSRKNTEMKRFHIFQKLLLPFTMVFSLKTYREIKRIIREQQINLVHVHNTLFLVSPSVYYAAFRCKVPVIQTVHNFRLLCPGATFFRDGHVCEECVENSLMCAVKYACYRNSKMQTLACVISTAIHRFLGTYRKLNYICLTEFNKKKLLMLNRIGRKKIIEEKKVFIKPNFTFSGIYEKKDKVTNYELDENGEKNRKNQFVYAGRLEKIKGIRVLFEAWRLLGEQAPDLIVCGNGEDKEWCVRFIEENHMDTIKMMGFLPNDKVKNIMAESKALIMPTQWYEGFPMTIVEAFSVAAPVIGADIGNVADLIKWSKAGWVFPPQDTEKLVECIKNYSDIRSSIYGVVYQKFSDDNNYKILNDIYTMCGTIKSIGEKKFISQ